MAAKRVLIRNRDGEEYSVTVASFRNTYQDEPGGWRIVSYEDGSEYEDDKPTRAPRAARAPEAEAAPEAAKE